MESFIRGSSPEPSVQNPFLLYTLKSMFDQAKNQRNNKKIALEVTRILFYDTHPPQVSRISHLPHFNLVNETISFESFQSSTNKNLQRLV